VYYLADAQYAAALGSLQGRTESLKFKRSHARAWWITLCTRRGRAVPKANRLTHTTCARVVSQPKPGVWMTRRAVAKVVNAYQWRRPHCRREFTGIPPRVMTPARPLHTVLRLSARLGGVILQLPGIKGEDHA
jgi:hypothetical protein